MRSIRYLLKGTPKNLDDILDRATKEGTSVHVRIDDKTTNILGYVFVTEYRVIAETGVHEVQLKRFADGGSWFLPNYEILRCAMRYGIKKAQQVESRGLAVQFMQSPLKDVLSKWQQEEHRYLQNKTG